MVMEDRALLLNWWMLKVLLQKLVNLESAVVALVVVDNAMATFPFTSRKIDGIQRRWCFVCGHLMMEVFADRQRHWRSYLICGILYYLSI